MAQDNKPSKMASVKKILKKVFKRRVKPPNFVISVAANSIKVLTALLLILSMCGAGALLGVAKAYFDTVPDLNVDSIQDQNLTSFIYDYNDQLITAYTGTENRIWADIDEMPQMLKDAYVAIEDARFYNHNGMDLKRLAGAFVNNLANETVQGGSTITQQLVKITMLSTEQTYKRKLQEVYIAMEMERTYEKDQILEWYLNTINLGAGNYGVKAAVSNYLGKDLADLTLRECAMLAGITRNPTKYDPRRNYYGAGKVEYTTDRTDYALKCMYENNFITKDEYEAALKASVSIIEESTTNQLYDMPAATETVIDDAVTLLLEDRNLKDTSENRNAIRAQIRTNGYHIYSTIDPKMQKIVEETVYDWEHYPSFSGAKAVTRSVGENGIIMETIQPQAAAVVYDYQVGEVRAIVGSRTPPTVYRAYNRATASTMPVGSSIKPLTVYGPALNSGLGAGSPIFNLPVPIDGWVSANGYPKNSTSGTYYGLVTIRTALKNSLNTASAHVMMDTVGVDTAASYLTSMGVNPSHINQDPFGVTLGSSGITPYEMAVCFGTIANKGVYQTPLTVRKIVDSQGNVILDAKAKQAQSKLQVYRPGTAWMLTDILTDAVTGGTGRSAKISGITTAGKTGTNSDYVGVSFSGMTAYYSCSVWIGHDEYEPLPNKASGGGVAAPLWKAIMTRIHEEQGCKDQPIISETPQELGLVKATLCSLSGMLASELCAKDSIFKPTTDYIHADAVPTKVCNQHHAVALCPLTGMIAGPYCGVHTDINDPSVIASGMYTLIKLFPQGSPVEKLSLEQINSLIPGAAPGTIDASGNVLTDNIASALQGQYCTWHSAFNWGIMPTLSPQGTLPPDDNDADG